MKKLFLLRVKGQDRWVHFLHNGGNLGSFHATPWENPLGVPTVLQRDTAVVIASEAARRLGVEIEVVEFAEVLR